MEILAPAGSIAALKAAIKGGADAVYLGLGEHNARIKSNDFTTDNLQEWVDYAHLFGVKVHLTLNTAVKDSEMKRVLELAEFAVNCGVDALIVADLGLARHLSLSSDIPLHLSTQAGVQNYKDLAALSDLRLKRVILARETLLSDIPAIKKQVKEVEIFAQGAMCVSFSGGCLLGSKIYGQSGNRGLCNQACRLTYRAFSSDGRFLKEGKLLSPRDLSLGERVKELSAYGVDSIKIEGRLKRPQYVYAATRYYRDILDGRDPSESLRALKLAFHRGFVSGYTQSKSASIIHEKLSGHIGINVGEVVRVIQKKGYKFAYVRSDHPFQKGDGAKILRNGEEVGGSDVTSVREENGLYLIPVSDQVKAGDEVRLTTDAVLELAGNQMENTLPLTLRVEGKVGEPIAITGECGGTSVCVRTASTADVAIAENHEPILQKLSKLGASDFHLDSIDDRLDGAVYVNASELNTARRELVMALRKRIIEKNTPRYTFRHDNKEQSVSLPIVDKRIAEVEVLEDIREPFDAFVLNPSHIKSEVVGSMMNKAKGRPVYLRLPKVVREGEINWYEKILADYPTLGVYADNLYAVTLAKERKRGLIVGFGMNVYNADHASLFGYADYVCGSTECSENGNLVFRAGKMPLMSFAHCPISVSCGKRCADCDKSVWTLRYETDGHEYLIRRQEGASCLFTMLEDAVTRYPISYQRKSMYYSFVGLNQEEKDDIMKCVSEDQGE